MPTAVVRIEPGPQAEACPRKGRRSSGRSWGGGGAARCVGFVGSLPVTSESGNGVFLTQYIRYSAPHPDRERLRRRRLSVRTAVDAGGGSTGGTCVPGTAAFSSCTSSGDGIVVFFRSGKESGDCAKAGAAAKRLCSEKPGQSGAHGKPPCLRSLRRGDQFRGITRKSLKLAGGYRRWEGICQGGFDSLSRGVYPRFWHCSTWSSTEKDEDQD